MTLASQQVNKPTDFFTTAAINRNVVIIDYDNIKEDDVIRATDEINPNSATDSAGFPAILLKSCKRVLESPLQSLLVKFPSKWQPSKQAERRENMSYPQGK